MTGNRAAHGRAPLHASIWTAALARVAVAQHELPGRPFHITCLRSACVARPRRVAVHVAPQRLARQRDVCCTGRRSSARVARRGGRGDQMGDLPLHAAFRPSLPRVVRHPHSRQLSQDVLRAFSQPRAKMRPAAPSVRRGGELARAGGGGRAGLAGHPGVHSAGGPRARPPAPQNTAARRHGKVRCARAGAACAGAGAGGRRRRPPLAASSRVLVSCRPALCKLRATRPQTTWLP